MPQLVGLQQYHRLRQVGILAKFARDRADQVLARFLVQTHVRFRGIDSRYRRLRGEIGRGVFFLGANLRIGFYLQIGLRSLLVFPIGQVPEHPCNSIRIVFHRNGGRAQAGITRLAMSVIERWASQPHCDVR